MTMYYITLPTEFASSTPPPTTLNITSADSISVSIDTSSFGSGADWARFSVSGCTATPITGLDGEAITITPTVGATSYSVTVRSVNESFGTFLYGRISGTISAPPTSDTTPDAFTFNDKTDVALSSTITSDPITVAGINAATGISITGGTYSINGGAYTSSSGTVTNGQTVTVQHTSSAVNSGVTNTTLNINGVTDTFTSTTIAVDNTPDAFAFTSATGQTISSTTTSGTTTVIGMSAGISITITSSNCTIDAGTSNLSGTFATSKIVTTSGTGTLVLAIRVTNSASNNTPTTGTATINGVSGTFTSTTVAAAADTTPNAFIFADQNDVAVSSTIVSGEIEILGINTGAPVSITGGEYSIGLDPTTYTAYTSAPGTIYNTQTVKVRHTSSASNSAPTNTTLIIGGISDVFTSTTIGASGSGIYGLQIFDSLGNITLDTSDITVKDFGIFSVASVTTNGTITGVPLTSNSIALVTNNNGDGDTAIAAPAVTLAPASSSIVVSGGAAGFDVSIRVMEF